MFTLHRFPASPELRRQWIAAVNRKDFTVSSWSRVCSRHFVGGRKTGENAVPALHLGYDRKAVIVPRGSSGRLSGSSEHSFRGTDAGDATTTDSEQHSMAFFVAQVGTSAQHETTIVPNSTVRSVGLGFPCAEASVGKACTGTQTTASSDAPLHVEKKGLANVTSLGEWSRARRVASRLVSHKIGQATAALQFNLPVAHKSVQCVPRVKSKSTQFSGTSTRTSRSRPTRRAAVRPSSASALKTT